MKMAGLCGMASVRVVFPRPLLLSNYHTTLDMFYNAPQSYISF